MEISAAEFKKSVARWKQFHITHHHVSDADAQLWAEWNALNPVVNAGKRNITLTLSEKQG
jgi:hypothetical protein